MAANWTAAGSDGGRRPLRLMRPVGNAELRQLP